MVAQKWLYSCLFQVVTPLQHKSFWYHRIFNYHNTHGWQGSFYERAQPMTACVTVLNACCQWLGAFTKWSLSWAWFLHITDDIIDCYNITIQSIQILSDFDKFYIFGQSSVHLSLESFVSLFLDGVPIFFFFFHFFGKVLMTFLSKHA